MVQAYSKDFLKMHNDMLHYSVEPLMPYIIARVSYSRQDIELLTLQIGKLDLFLLIKKKFFF